MKTEKLSRYCIKTSSLSVNCMTGNTQNRCLFVYLLHKSYMYVTILLHIVGIFKDFLYLCNLNELK